MKLKNHLPILLPARIFMLFSCKTNQPKTAEKVLNAPLFHYQDLEPRWNSFENPTSEKGTGAMENKGAKGHPFDKLKAGESKTLLEVQGTGIIARMWFTIQDRSPQMLRSLKIEMYWDNADKPVNQLTQLAKTEVRTYKLK